MRWHFKFEPVLWLTTLAAVLGTALQVDSEYHVLPAGWAHWIAAAAAFVALLLVAIRARGASTPLADPKAANGRTLVPTPPAQVPPGTPHAYLKADGS